MLSDRVFTHCIRCDDDDYRYSQQTAIEPSKLDQALEDRCVKLARDLGLVFAGIDLRRCVDGTWYCFEVNPSPGFTYFDVGAMTVVEALDSVTLNVRGAIYGSIEGHTSDDFRLGYTL